MDIWVFPPWCKSDTVGNSGTRCFGTVGAVCEFMCDDGHTSHGTHICETSGYFAGGTCVPSTCETPVLLPSQIVSFGCGTSGAHGDACHLACAEDYWATSDPVPGTCSPDSGSSTSSYQLQETSCEAVTSCSPLEFETVSPTAVSDRQCANLTVCTELEYELVAPTTASNRVCAVLRVCTESEYESLAASSTSNRECADLRECDIGEYELVAPTAFSDRICATVTSCSLDEYQVSASTPFSNTVCRPISACTFWQYEVEPPTLTSDRVCTPWCAAPELTVGQAFPLPSPVAGRAVFAPPQPTDNNATLDAIWACSPPSASRRSAPPPRPPPLASSAPRRCRGSKNSTSNRCDA